MMHQAKLEFFHSQKRAWRRKYRQKRVKRSPVVPFVDFTINPYDDKETMAMFAFTVAAAAFGNYLVQEQPLSVAAPPVCPEGGCGGLPRGRGKFIKEARSLFNDLIKSAGLPKGLNPVSVFPPYADEKVISDSNKNLLKKKMVHVDKVK